MANVLAIAGSDTSSGAGMQADLKTFAALGVYCTSVITAVTAQSTRKIIKVSEVAPSVVGAQIDAVLGDISVDSVKIGMVYSKGIIDVVASRLKKIRKPVVLDPVFRASTGALLLRDDAYPSFVRKLLPLSTVVTPNVMEAERLAGMKIHDIDDVKEAARRISRLGPSCVIKGGHMRGRSATDMLYHKGRFVEFGAARIRSRQMHGIGSVYSATLAAELAKGSDVIEAAEAASMVARRSIANAIKVGRGLGVPVLGRIYPQDKLLATLQKAVDRLERLDNLADLIPESQSNIVFAKPGARSVDDIAGVTGRMVRIDKNAIAAGNVSFGASKHVATAVLAAMRHDKTIRAAMNIKYDESIIKICRALGLEVSNYDRTKEPKSVKKKEGMSVKWGIQQAVAKTGAVPDVIYHIGDWGKEPMIILFGNKPMDVMRTVWAILAKYQRG